MALTHDQRVMLLVKYGISPSDAERMVYDSEANFDALLADTTLARLTDYSEVDRDRSRTWWYFLLLIPPAWKRILDARRGAWLRADEAAGTSTTRMPGYAWDPAAALGGAYRYIRADGTVGGVVGSKDLLTLLVNLVDRVGLRLGALASGVVSGQLRPVDLQTAMVSELKSLYAVLVALARGGWSGVTQADWIGNSRILREQFARVGEFGRALQSGELTEAQAMQRAGLYVDRAFSHYWEVRTQVMAEAGGTQMRLITAGDDRVCGICLAEEDQGWVPIGTGAVGGELHPGCRCSNEYR